MNFPARLIDGYLSFRQTRLPIEQNRYRELGDSGQKPVIMLIGCCDSRVSPEVIFDSRPGEMFVVRNVANLVPPYEPDGHAHGVSAALEFGVQSLKVEHLVVLGHGSCGGIRAFAEQSKPLSPGDFIGKWISLIQPAANEVGPKSDPPTKEYLAALERASVLHTLSNLMSFPFIKSRVEHGLLKLHAAHFEVATGLMSVYDEETKRFLSADS